MKSDLGDKAETEWLNLSYADVQIQLKASDSYFSKIMASALNFSYQGLNLLHLLRGG